MYEAFPCLSCRHCWLDGGSPGYSDLTPATPMSWECSKGHFDLGDRNLSTESVKTVLELGKTCKDYADGA